MTVETISEAFTKIAELLPKDELVLRVRSSPIYDEGPPRRGFKVAGWTKNDPSKVVEVYANNA